MQKLAIEESNADAIFISPVTGIKKKGDFRAVALIRCLEKLIEEGFYNPFGVLIGPLNTYSRYCGPREAIFTALCRKNFGCNHFIIGRDHTGVGDYYKSSANYEIFKKIGDIGIKPIFFEDVAYNFETKFYEEVTDKGNYGKISGTEARETLKSMKDLPEWFMDKEIQEMVKQMIKQGGEVFH